MSYELPSAPLSIGGVLDNAIRLYRHAMGRCWVLALIYAGVLGCFGVLWTLALGNVVAEGGAGRVAPGQLAAVLFSPLTIGGFLVAITVSMALYGALVKAEVTLARGGEFSLGESLGAGLRRLPGVLLASVITMLAFSVGFVLLIIPGIYLIVKMQLWVVAMFVDDASALESISTSWRLTDKRWWRTFVILSVAFILIYVFALAFGIIAGIVAAVAHYSFANRLLVNQVFSFLSNIIVVPMTVAIGVVLYHDYKLRSEGGDLALRVGSLGKA
jgi:hypothetical protein